MVIDIYLLGRVCQVGTYILSVDIANLYEHHEAEGSLGDNSNVKQQCPKNQLGKIEKELNSRVGRSRRGKEYLIKWKDIPVKDSSWISQKKMDHFDSSRASKSKTHFLINSGCLMQEHLGFRAILHQPKKIVSSFASLFRSIDHFSDP